MSDDTARWRQPVFAGLVVLGVLILAHFNPRPNDFYQIVWASMGAVGSTYAWPIVLRNVLLELDRRAEGENGLYAIVCQATLGTSASILACLLLITGSGLAAILGGPRELILSLLISIAVVLTHAAWYADHKAGQQRDYVRNRPEPDPS